MKRENILIEQGDYEIELTIKLSIAEVKALHNLCNEQQEEMTGYHQTAKKLKEIVDLSFLYMEPQENDDEFCVDADGKITGVLFIDKDETEFRMMEEKFQEKIESGDCIKHSELENGFGYYVTVDGFDYTVYETFTEFTNEDGITLDVIKTYTWEQADENEVREFLEVE